MTRIRFLSRPHPHPWQISPPLSTPRSTKKGKQRRGRGSNPHLVTMFRNVVGFGIIVLLGMAGMGWTLRRIGVMIIVNQNRYNNNQYPLEIPQQQQKVTEETRTTTLNQKQQQQQFPPSRLVSPHKQSQEDEKEEEEVVEAERVMEEEMETENGMENEEETIQKTLSSNLPNKKTRYASAATKTTAYFSTGLTKSYFFHTDIKQQRLPTSSTTKDYNDLQLKLSRRTARSKDMEEEEQYHARVLDSEDADETKLRRYKRDLWSDMDDPDMDEYYYRFEERTYPKECISLSWTDQQYPNCNTFHEIALDTIQDPYEISYLGQGHYRDSFLFRAMTSQHEDGNRHSQQKREEKFVLKHLRMRRGFDYKRISQMHTEALLMEKFSGSPRFTNIYGYCATSLLVEIANEISERIVPFHTEIQTEAGRISQTKLDALEKTRPDSIYAFNNFTTEEKLEIAIQMAEALAEMHGFSLGVIANDDFHPDQFLITDAGNVILNDMNNAVYLEWNPTKQKYCEYYSSFGGDFRDPREYVGSYVDESVDIPPMGYSIFILLTGLWPYYEHPYDEREKLQSLAIAGTLPYINPAHKTRSLIEKRMVEIMYRCMAQKASDRPDIFEVLRFLYETKAMHKKEIQRTKSTSKLRR